MCEYAKLRAIHSIFRTLHSIHVQNLQDRNLYVFFFDECDYFVEQTSLNLSEEGRGLRPIHAFALQVEEKVLVALESCTTSKTILLYPLCFHISSLGQRCVLSREMENISRGRTFGDFVTIRTERSMQDVTVARLQSTRVKKTPIAPLF